MCACSEGSGEIARMRRRVWTFDDQIFNKCQKSHQSAHFFTKKPFPFENSGCSLISVYALVQSNQGYCDLHTQHMIMKVCMHKVLLNRFRATYPKHCYMIIDSSYMTEKMLIVILSTNAPTKRMKFKAITEKKKTIKKIIFLFYLAGFEPVWWPFLCSVLCH